MAAGWVGAVMKDFCRRLSVARSLCPIDPSIRGRLATVVHEVRQLLIDDD